MKESLSLKAFGLKIPGQVSLDEFYRRVKAVLNHLSAGFSNEIIFINDSSTDQTLLKLKNIASSDPNVKIINFSRNFGNQAAISAGIEYCTGDIAVIIDDDLQDLPEVILEFLSKWSEGYKVVYGIRSKRPMINPIFKILASIYYRIISALSDIHIPNDVGDFRLIDKVIIEKLRLLKEENIYYRGMVSWVGYSQIGVLYERDKRYSGKSNFTFSKYFKFAVNGLTSFTDKPLYFSALIGLFITILTFALGIVLVLIKIFTPNATITGWTSLAILILFFGGIQLLSVGIVGIYIGKIYREVKKRPIYLTDELVNFDKE